jgi:hypothetical protein
VIVGFSTDQKADMIGKILAEYRIVEELGGQAGALVYKAIGFDARRPVAIKLFPPELSRDKPKLQALLDSLRKISRLDQPGIPRLIGSGLSGGRAYIIMPYMTGGSLQDRLEIGQVSTADALGLLDRIAAALERTHKLGVVHGHLSPVEVMFDDTGQPQIIGLGQAPVLLADRGLTAELASGEHVAPEVRAGEQPTPASDQYSVAVIAFELLTGRCVDEALNEGDESADEATSAPEIHLSPRVAEVLKRGLQDDPSHRYLDVSEMVHALRAAVRADALAVRTPRLTTAAASARSPSRIGRSLGWGVASLAVVTLGCLMLSLPALAAARWMRLDLGSVTDLFTRPQPKADAAAPADAPRIYVPGLPASMPTPTPADTQQAPLPTMARLVEAPEPTQVEAPANDGHEHAAPTELSAADEPSIDREAIDTPAPGSAFVEDPTDGDPTQTFWLAAPQGDSQQPSPTPSAPLATPTGWSGCSNGAQGCTDTLPTH